MTPQPPATPPLNGHSHTSAVRLRQAICDRWGRRYTLLGQVDAAGCDFTVETPEAHPVGRLRLEISGATGRLTQLHIADQVTPKIPRWFKRALVRWFPHTITGHRGRGLGSLLVIYALKTACDLELNEVVVPGPISAAALRLFRDLGFVGDVATAAIAATYRISAPLP